MNQIVLIGRLTRDSELKESSSGLKITKFTICTQDKKVEAQTYFHNITLFGDRGLELSPYLKKGTEAMIVGKSCPSSYTDKDGNKKYTHTIIAYEVRIFQNILVNKEKESERIKKFLEADFSDFDFPSKHTEAEDF